MLKESLSHTDNNEVSHVLEVERSDTLTLIHRRQLFNRYKCKTLVNISILFIMLGILVVAVAINKVSLKTSNKPIFHMVPHSHDDLGWILTVQGYYNLSVKHTLETSTDYLYKHPNSKFTFADTAFMQIWLEENPEKQEIVKYLVSNGQLEIVNGMLSQMDTACNYYEDVLFAFQHGLHWVKQHTGATPNIGWMIDPFGISYTVRRMFAEMGYNGLVINRIGSSRRDQRLKNGSLDFNWLDKHSNSLLTSELPQHYNEPYPMKVDIPFTSTDTARIYELDITSHKFDFIDAFNAMCDTIGRYAQGHQTPHVLIPFGDDFWYSNFSNTYQYLEVIDIIYMSNQHTGRYYDRLNIRISNVSTYLTSVREYYESDIFKTLQTYQGDFMPLLEGNIHTSNHISWTGYYTTNPYGKHMMKMYGQVVRSLMHVVAMNKLYSDELDYDVMKQLSYSIWLTGVNTHHDTITGTSKNAVANNYIELILTDIDRLQSLFKDYFTKYYGINDIDFTFITHTSEKPMINKEGWYYFMSTGVSNITQQVRLFTSNNTRLVVDNTTADTSCTSVACEHILRVDTGIHYISFIDLYRHVNQLYMNKMYTVSKLQFLVSNNQLWIWDNEHDIDLRIGIYQYIYDHTSSMSKNNQGKYIFTSSHVATVVDIDLQYNTYEVIDNTVSIDISYMDRLVNLHVVYTNTSIASDRLYVRIDMLDIDDDRGYNNTNYVVRYYSNIYNDKLFTTDSNGLDDMDRIYGRYSKTIDVNYYPITKYVYIKDTNRLMSVNVDRSCGCSSTQQGSIEVMLNRISTTDDWLGAGEGVNETATVSILHRLVIDTSNSIDYRYIQVQDDSTSIVVYTGIHIDTVAYKYIQVDTYTRLYTSYISNSIYLHTICLHTLTCTIHIYDVCKIYPVKDMRYADETNGDWTTGTIELQPLEMRMYKIKCNVQD